jgi:hypothetical protein
MHVIRHYINILDHVDHHIYETVASPAVSIEVNPMPTDGDISTENLRNFYASFGFRIDPISGWMVR